MNTKDTLSFLGSLTSKICHDIVAPVSAVDMGISLLEDQLPLPIKEDPAYILLKDSLDKTLCRINFFRYAFAFGKTDSPPTRQEFIDHCQNACAHLKIRFTLEELELPSSDSTLLLRIVACVLYLLIDALPKGGSINLSISPKLISFDANGPLVLMSSSLDKINQKFREAFRAQTILPELILMGLGELNLHLEMRHTPTSLNILMR